MRPDESSVGELLELRQDLGEIVWIPKFLARRDGGDVVVDGDRHSDSTGEGEDSENAGWSARGRSPVVRLVRSLLRDMASPIRRRLEPGRPPRLTEIRRVSPRAC